MATPSSAPPKIKLHEVTFVGRYVSSMKDRPKTLENMVYTFCIEMQGYKWLARKKFSEVRAFLKAVLSPMKE